jgi:hypothetical protein
VEATKQKEDKRKKHYLGLVIRIVGIFILAISYRPYVPECASMGTDATFYPDSCRADVPFHEESSTFLFLKL